MSPPAPPCDILCCGSFLLCIRPRRVSRTHRTVKKGVVVALLRHHSDVFLNKGFKTRYAFLWAREPCIYGSWGHSYLYVLTELWQQFETESQGSLLCNSARQCHNLGIVTTTTQSLQTVSTSAPVYARADSRERIALGGRHIAIPTARIIPYVLII